MVASKSPASQFAEDVAAILRDCYPDAHCALHYHNAYELLVATVLSAQTTDARVNTVTPQLFSLYPDPQHLAQATPEQLSALVRPLGFQHRRTTQLRQLAQQLVTEFDGEVPGDLKSLQSLPGVGRKTAHVVLGNYFGIPAITVDTHVGRLARRLGWSQAKDPLAVEKDIAQLLPDYDWTILCHRLIEHGRQVCRARDPQCGNCALAQLCPSAQ